MTRPFASVRYINLARRPDRRARAEEELARLGWTDARRIDAVDATTFDPAEWVRRGAVAPGARLTRPAMACIASHFLGWTEIAATAADDEWWLILEDDFRAHPVVVERPEIWRAYWDALPTDSGLVMVGSLGFREGELERSGAVLNPMVVRLAVNLYGTQAYAVTGRFAREHLARYFPLAEGIDSFARFLAPVDAFRSIDDARWGCVTPADFYPVDRSADHAAPLVYFGLVSVRPGTSDIQYGRAGVVAKLAAMRELMHRGEHEAVRTHALDAKPELMRQLFPDLYVQFLDICITSYWYVARVEGFALVHRLIETARADPELARLLAPEAPRICGNLVFYRADLAREAEAVLRARP